MAAPDEKPNWKGPYLRQMPKDAWQNEYVYKSPGEVNTKHFDLYSMGPDGKDGTGDEIANFETEGGK